MKVKHKRTHIQISTDPSYNADSC
uniref:Uncharacterized protein n=1 Tax=Tetranychus urticae TaxID=32264 RepID=T1K1S6_TETUR